MMRFVFLFLVFNLISCTSYYKVHVIDGKDLSELKSDTTSVLRTDGLYSLYDDDAKGRLDTNKYKRFAVSRPLIFINENKAFWHNHIGYFDNQALHLSNYEMLPQFDIFIGDYVIRNDTIIAKLPVILNVGGGGLSTYEAYFEGVIQNSDTIIDWHIIPPYPKVNMKFNNDLHFLKTPHILTFIESKELLGLDSLYQKRLREEE